MRACGACRGVDRSAWGDAAGVGGWGAFGFGERDVEEAGWEAPAGGCIVAPALSHCGMLCGLQAVALQMLCPHVLGTAPPRHAAPRAIRCDAMARYDSAPDLIMRS